MGRIASRAGWIRGVMTFPSVGSAPATPHFNGTGALTLVLSFTPGFQLVFEALGFCTSGVVGATAGTQTFKLRKGGASGTVLATLTLAFGDVDALGETKIAAVSASIADLTLTDGGTFSITRDASGTDFTTKPEGFFFVRFRQQPQQS